jgi:hypothetical protein
MHIDQAWHDERTGRVNNMVSASIDMGSKAYYLAIRYCDIQDLVAPGRGIEKAPIPY